MFYLASTNDTFKKQLSEKLGFESEKVVCGGCRNIEGNCQVLKNYGFSGNCKIYHCAKDHHVEFCNNCTEFPCDLLHPLADRADKFPHNLKVFNLCMIKKMGLENWAKNQSKRSWDRYYNDTLDSCV
jgi:hypothetical protein